MIRRIASLLLVLPAALVLAPLPARAEEDPVRLAAALTELAEPELGRGRYADAEANLKEALEVDPTNGTAARLLARLFEETGRLEDAYAVLEPFAGDPAAATERAHLLLLRGRVEEAEAALREVLARAEGNLRARRLLGAALEATGRRDDAIAQYTDVNARWARMEEGTESADELLAEARARLGVYRLDPEYKASLDSVLTRLDQVRKRDPGRLDVLVELADLYLAQHQDIDAKKWYEKALAQNPHYAPAIHGLAQQMAFRYDEPAAAKECERALRSNPAHVPSLLFIASMHAGDGYYGKAVPFLERALAVNPHDPRARGLRAAIHYLEGDTARFEAEVAEVLRRNRFASDPYRVLAEALEDHRRFQEAYEFARKATETDPLDWYAHFLAGRNAMNVGEDEIAVELLRAAEKGDPFRNLYRHNFLELYDKLERFPVRRDARFVVKLPPVEEEPYFPLLRAALDDSLAGLERKWAFETETPLYISVFDQQADFAVRTIGLAGFPALGACFGRLVTLDSPRALPPGAFGWRATLHHELAHVITLQLSRGRVPRWLTEGLSVYEERKVSPVWNREMERELIDAIASDEVLTLDEVNNAFRGPRVLYAYYQGGLMCELVERDFGFDKLREMVRLYGEGLDTPEVVRKALGIEPTEFDRRFLAFAKDLVKDLRVLPRPSHEKMAALRLHLRKQKDDGDAWMLYALGHAARGDSAAALSALGRAVELVPEDGRIPAVRALVAWRTQRPDQARKHAEEAIAKGSDWFDLRMALADQAQREKRFEEAKTHLRRAIELFPVAPDGADPRLQLAEMLLGEGEAKLDEAMELLRAHCAVAEDDYATRVKLTGWLRDKGRTDEELATLLEIRDIVPLPHGPWSREMAIGLHERIATLELARETYGPAELAARTAVAVARMDLGGGRADVADDVRQAELLALHAETLHLLGRADEARRRLEESLRADPDCERARELERRLGS